MIRAFWSGDENSKLVVEHNWGDIVTPYIIKHISGKKAVNRRRKCHGRMLIVGSLMHRVRHQDKVWGSGALSPEHIVNPLPEGIKFYAVRGPMTRKELIKLGADVPEIYGDPALLMPHILKVEPLEDKYELGIMPHVNDYDALKHLSSDRVKVIDMCGGAEKVMREVRSCDQIISSSLHGVILGDAYKKPTAWLVVDNSKRLYGGEWKFHDYFASTNRDGVSNIVGAGEDLPKIKWLKPPTIDLAPLLRACPLKEGK